MWMDLLSHGGPTLPCRSTCQVLIIYQLDILMLVFVRTPSNFVSLQEDLFWGAWGVVGKILQLAVWSVCKGYCYTEYVASRSLLLSLSILCSTKFKSPLRGLGKMSIYNISVKSNVLV